MSRRSPGRRGIRCWRETVAGGVRERLGAPHAPGQPLTRGHDRRGPRPCGLPVWLSQVAEVIRGTSAADEQLRHELWETWRLTTAVRTHAAVTDRPTPSQPISPLTLPPLTSLRTFPVTYAMIESRPSMETKRLARRRQGGFCHGPGSGDGLAAPAGSRDLSHPQAPVHARRGATGDPEGRTALLATPGGR